MLYLRTAVKEDAQYSAAEMLYGQALRLPGQFFDTKIQINTEPLNSYTKELIIAMGDVAAVATRAVTKNKGYIDQALAEATHVFVRDDAIKQPLSPAYKGPFKVIKRASSYYTLDLGNKIDTVSIARLKPAYLEYNYLQSLADVIHPYNRGKQLKPILKQDVQEEKRHQRRVTFEQPVCTTRSGRNVRVPQRYRT
jgi:hypothetical protein